MDRLISDFNNDRLLPTCEMLDVLNNTYGNDPRTFSNIYTTKKYAKFKKRIFLADDAYSIYVDKVSYELFAWSQTLKSMQNNGRRKWYKVVEHDTASGPEYNIDFSYKQIILNANTSLLLSYARHERFDTIQRTVDFLNYALKRGLGNANDSIIDCVEKLPPDEINVFNRYSTIRPNKDKAIDKLTDFGFSTVNIDVQESGHLIHYIETVRYAPLNIEFTQISHKSTIQAPDKSSGCLTAWEQWTYKGKY